MKTKEKKSILQSPYYNKQLKVQYNEDNDITRTFLTDISAT